MAPGRSHPGRVGRRCTWQTGAQVDAVYPAFPKPLRPAILLGAFADLRTAEAVGLRQGHVDRTRRGLTRTNVQVRPLL